MKKDKQGFITDLDTNEIFVFGSNLAGEHFGGAAKTALDKFGAIMGQYWGMQGQSFAIPTLDINRRKLPLNGIKSLLAVFAKYAQRKPDNIFYLTPIGTGIAGFTHKEIKSILPKFSDNVVVDNSLK